MARGLRDAFPEFYRPSRGDLSDMIRHGLIVLDANTLLDLYRFTATARGELLGVLAQLGDRLWVPYRVALEFYRGRIGVIADRTTAPLELISDLEKIEESAISKIGAFGNRFGVPPNALRELVDGVKNAFGSAKSAMRDVHETYDLSLDNLDNDPVIAALEGLLHDRVGNRPTDEELEVARKEAERRIRDGIPPGFRDAGKDKERAAGDCLWWLELLKEATVRKLPVVLITNDAKDDFIFRVQGQTIGPRPELKDELSRKAGVSFHILNTRGLLVNARDLLNADVSDSTLAETAAAEAGREGLAPEDITGENDIEVDRRVIKAFEGSVSPSTAYSKEESLRRREAVADCFSGDLRGSIRISGGGISTDVFIRTNDFDVRNLPRPIIAKLLEVAGTITTTIYVKTTEPHFSLIINPRGTWNILEFSREPADTSDR